MSNKFPCGGYTCVEAEFKRKFGCKGCRLNFTKTRPSQQHCTQCESKKDNPWCSNCKEKDCVVSSDGTCAMIRKYLSLTAEVERLKEIIKETFINNLHIFCPSCKEKDCLCMLDSTCEKLRNILDGKK